ncbi:UvrD-helicase domain-containing protein [Murimonas intestini]|uniref:DNA 3'-5' helicase n=1 Tax=Murimonas intestini TaxID=1337051 RepID=A0AB73T648_9FIRM|nr:ATP-dependent helicase [Murimonas intestini]MCR1842111.1 ATP-dependent helicase [Murimonas intestini]MCR1864848.1 ATP-dependent helicase [Murimonas intestini]MCR1884175.1 ATP-dependent helicase [Murimonas intestini]
MIKKPTEEQISILEQNGNVVVTARPGSGKTYTVVEKIGLVLKELPDYKGIIAISFTNKASDELKSRCKQRGIEHKNSFFGTIDKFYISQIIIPFASHLTYTLPEYEVVNSSESDPIYSGLFGMGSDVTNDQEILLLESLKNGKIFLDVSGETALYIMKKVPGALQYIKSRYVSVFIDEYQDCGQIQHDIFIMLCESGLIGVAVGDINQAIYGFSNRFPKYLLSLIGREDFKHYELSVNHRCHPSIAEYSLCLFDASKQIQEDKRVFRVCVEGSEREIAKKIDQKLQAIKKTYEVVSNNQVAILCRGNGTIHFLDTVLKTKHKVFSESPLDKDNSNWGRIFCELLNARFDKSIYAVDYAEKLFSEEIEPDRYRKALEVCHKIFSCPFGEMINVIDNFIEIAELVYPKGYNAGTVALLKHVLSDSTALNSYVPAAEDELNIMTLHKSKGLEFNIVFHMDMYKYIISDEYGTADEIEQLLNLHYVGITRAKDACFIMNGTQRYRSRQNDFYKAYPSSFLLKDGLQERRRELRW